MQHARFFPSSLAVSRSDATFHKCVHVRGLVRDMESKTWLAQKPQSLASVGRTSELVAAKGCALFFLINSNYIDKIYLELFKLIFLAYKISTSASNQVMLYQHQYNIIYHIILHNNKILKLFISLIRYSLFKIMFHRCVLRDEMNKTRSHLHML
jgi:hypothetical protein